MPTHPAEETVTVTVEDQLARIVTHLERMDRRDKLRTWGGFTRGVLGLLPLAIFFWSIWYVTTHMDEIIRTVSEEAALAASKYTQSYSEDIIDKFQGLVPKK
jgi:hypothetical protein